MTHQCREFIDFNCPKEIGNVEENFTPRFFISSDPYIKTSVIFKAKKCANSLAREEPFPSSPNDVSFDCWDVSAMSNVKFDPTDSRNFCRPKNGLCRTSTYAYALLSQAVGFSTRVTKNVIGIIRDCEAPEQTEAEWKARILKPPFHR